MKWVQLDSGKWLDMGTGIFALSLLIGAGMIISALMMNQRQSNLQKTKEAISSGEIPVERHQNIQTVAAR